MRMNTWHEPNGGDSHLVLTIRHKKGHDKLLACGQAQGSGRGRYILTERLDTITCPQCQEAVESIWTAVGAVS